MKNILIIGGAQGIGQALATQWAANANNLFITSRRFDEPENVSEGLFHINCDLSQAESISAAFDYIEQQVDYLDWIINCAGVLHNADYQPEKSLQQVNQNNLLHSYQVNAVGHLLALKQAEKLLVHAEHGLAVSISARIGSIEDNHLGGWYAYRMSKAALNMGIKTLSIEWARKHPQIKFILLHPGTTDTPLSKPFQKRLPQGQLQTADETADMLIEQIEKHQQHTHKEALFLDYAGKTIPW